MTLSVRKILKLSWILYWLRRDADAKLVPGGNLIFQCYIFALINWICHPFRLPEDEISVGSLLGVDGTARQALNVMTGMSLVDEEVTAMSLGVPLVRSEEDEHNRQTITAAEELLLCHGPSESSHPEANEEHSTHHHINQGEKSSTPKPSAGEDIPAHHHVHQKNESSPTDETESTTRPPPPLPKLPETHNVPLRIPEGHFNPVLHSIQKFLT